MDVQQILYLLLSGFVRQLPQLIVIIGGIALCFSNRAKSPQAGKTALAGLFILFFANLFLITLFPVQVYLPVWFRDSFQTIGYINLVVSIVFSLVSAGGLGLIIYAVWAGRDR